MQSKEACTSTGYRANLRIVTYDTVIEDEGSNIPFTPEKDCVSLYPVAG